MGKARGKGRRAGARPCSYCGNGLPPSAEVVYIRTQRGTELYICPKCYRGTLKKYKQKPG
ncbi:hypothetical protein IMSAGC019_03107 [Lachnospiraceae bacterium]|nr:hypothetical protein IMSAGC019_03107 [Lachnospiraceae bacterium]